MYPSPKVAFTAFLEKMRASSKHQLKTEDFLDVLEPFLANPERHRKHVSHILDAARGAARISEMQRFLKSNTMSTFQWFATLMYSRKIPSEIETWVKEIQELGDSLELENDPVDLGIDFLEFRDAETDPSWKKMDKKVRKSEIRISIRPQDGFRVNRVSLAVDFGDSQVQIIRATPENEIDLVERVTERGRSLTHSEGTTTDKSLSLAAKPLGFEAGIGFTDSRALNKQNTESIKETLKDLVARPKIICSGVGSDVRWDLYPTAQVLSGNRSFIAHLLIPSEVSWLTVTAQLTAELSSWGPSHMHDERKLKVE